MMRKMIINGHEVTTNYEKYGSYPMCDGNDKKTMRMMIRENCRESAEEMLERLAGYGYTRITFYETSTRVKGIHNLIAYCKK